MLHVASLIFHTPTKLLVGSKTYLKHIQESKNQKETNVATNLRTLLVAINTCTMLQVVSLLFHTPTKLLVASNPYSTSTMQKEFIQDYESPTCLEK